MRIISKNKFSYILKPDGSKVRYFLFDEYKLYFCENMPGNDDGWHHHEKLWETVFVVQGQLTIKWKEQGKIKKKIVREGDLIEMENTPHQLINHTSTIMKVICIKQILSGKNKRNILKKDKVVDEPR
jgi:mannose-6-phosphate isomerase-like protein (cupin superfamily)